MYLSIHLSFCLSMNISHRHTQNKPPESLCEPSSQSLQTVSSIYLCSCYFSPVGRSKVMSTRDLFLCRAQAHVCVFECQCPHCSQIRLIPQTLWPWARFASCLSLTDFLPGGTRGLIQIMLLFHLKTVWFIYFTRNCVCGCTEIHNTYSVRDFVLYVCSYLINMSHLSVHVLYSYQVQRCGHFCSCTAITLL